MLPQTTAFDIHFSCWTSKGLSVAYHDCTETTSHVLFITSDHLMQLLYEEGFISDYHRLYRVRQTVGTDCPEVNYYLWYSLEEYMEANMDDALAGMLVTAYHKQVTL